jgi:SAM-dependent methyltransferase
MTKNIAYRSEALARHFTRHRIAWDDFYESERVVIDRLRLGPHHTVLDVGCGCGGLGLALRDRFGTNDYTGVEINRPAADAARAMNPEARIVCGDILDVSAGALAGCEFDVVFSLSCVDWNVCFVEMLAAAWRHVRPGGNLVATFRLTTAVGCDDITRSYQHIDCERRDDGERAAYVVLNASALMNRLRALDAVRITGYGYWGAPSPTAVTPYERLCFAAFAVRRRLPGDAHPLRCELELPPEIRDAAGA